MSEGIACFDKVSLNQFLKDSKNYLLDNSESLYQKERYKLIEDYNNIKMPERSTVYSAGYDFYAPIDIEMLPGKTYTIPTGIRCKINPEFVLFVLPRSSLGFKYGLRLRNTIGVIDSDYYNADNEGHIMLKLVADQPLKIHEGDRMVQGIFLQYGITINDDAHAQRTGGIGSTGA